MGQSHAGGETVFTVKNTETVYTRAKSRVVTNRLKGGDGELCARACLKLHCATHLGERVGAVSSIQNTSYRPGTCLMHEALLQLAKNTAL